MVTERQGDMDFERKYSKSRQDKTKYYPCWMSLTTKPSPWQNLIYREIIFTRVNIKRTDREYNHWILELKNPQK